MNTTALWTSTQFQNWKTDCAKFIASHQTFEVQDVNGPEQERVCINLCELHHYTYAVQKRVATCTPAVPAAAATSAQDS